MTPEQVQLLREALPVIGTLLGAAVGVVGGAFATWLQTRAESKRQRQRLALELGLQEWRATLDHATASKTPTSLYPPASYIHLYVELLKLIERDDLSPVALKLALQRSLQVAGVFDEFDVERRARVKAMLAKRTE